MQSLELYSNHWSFVVFTIFAFQFDPSRGIDGDQYNTTNLLSDTNDEFYALSKIKLPNSINITDVYKNHIFPGVDGIKNIGILGTISYPEIQKWLISNNLSKKDIPKESLPSEPILYYVLFDNCKKLEALKNTSLTETSKFYEVSCNLERK